MEPLQRSHTASLRWGQADLFTLVPDGGKRTQAVIRRWDLRVTRGG
jgi:hypothetical protein